MDVLIAFFMKKMEQKIAKKYPCYPNLPKQKHNLIFQKVENE